MTLEITDCYLTLEEARTYCSVQRKTLSRARKSGLLKVTARPTRVRLDHFNRFLGKKYPKLSPMTAEGLYAWRGHQVSVTDYLATLNQKGQQ